MSSHDLVIIGGGPAGYAAALYGSVSGLDVGLVERDKLGGTCLHRGCIPAKELLETASIFQSLGGLSDFGITGIAGMAGAASGGNESANEASGKSGSALGLDMAKVQERKAGIIDKLFKGLSGTLEAKGISIYNGTGYLERGRTVKVSGADGETITLEPPSVILATGSEPRDIPGLEADGDMVVNSDHLLDWRELPESVAIIGAGAIGVEFASLLSDMGTEVLLLEAAPDILPGADADISAVVKRSFKSRGIEVVVGVQVSGIDKKDGKAVIHYSQPPEGQAPKEEASEEQTSKEPISKEVSKVIISTGRRPFADLLKLENTEIKLTPEGFAEVNSSCLTAQEGVYAIGDLIDTPQLAHVGFAEGIYVIKHLLGEQPSPIDYSKVPWCIYSRPEVAFVGLTEEAAKAEGHDVEVAKHRFAGNARAMILGETEGLVKLVSEKDGRILGVHLAGPWVTEQLGAGYLAVNWDATSFDLADLVSPHPSLSEAFGEAAMALTGRPLHG